MERVCQIYKHHWAGSQFVTVRSSQCIPILTYCKAHALKPKTDKTEEEKERVKKKKISPSDHLPRYVSGFKVFCINLLGMLGCVSCLLCADSFRLCLTSTLATYPGVRPMSGGGGCWSQGRGGGEVGWGGGCSRLWRGWWCCRQWWGGFLQQQTGQ